MEKIFKAMVGFHSWIENGGCFQPHIERRINRGLFGAMAFLLGVVIGCNVIPRWL